MTVAGVQADEDVMEVEMEAVEHAYLDFMVMELGLESNTVLSDWMFNRKEENNAHTELDELWKELSGKSLEVEYHGVLNDIDKEERAGHGEDLCDKDAYFNGGMWWIDRWVRTSGTSVNKSAVKVGHGKNKAVGIYTEHLLHGHIVRPKSYNVLAINTTNEIRHIPCTGTLKRRWTGRSGSWWPSSGSSWTTQRSSWRSTRLARVRQGELSQDIQTRHSELNDKCSFMNLPRAKDNCVPGGGGWTEEASKLMDKDTSNTSMQNIIIMANPLSKPGSSGTTVKDDPGKDILNPVSNLIFKEHEDSEDHGKEVEGGGGQGQHGVCHAPEDGGVHEVHLPVEREGSLGLGCGKQEVGESRQQDLGAGEGQQQQRDRTGHVRERDDSLGDGRVDEAGRNSVMTFLKHPTADDSPGYAKMRRRRVPDGLVQVRLNFFSKLESSKKIVPSVGVSIPGPSRGPLQHIERERGTKRSLGDQMGGPADKKWKD